MLDQLPEVRLRGSGSRALTQGTELGEVTAKQPRAGVWREHQLTVGRIACPGQMGHQAARHYQESLQQVAAGLVTARDPQDSTHTLKAERRG